MDNDFKQMIEKYKSELMSYHSAHGQNSDNSAGMPAPAAPAQPNSTSSPTPAPDIPVMPQSQPEIPMMPQSQPEIMSPTQAQPEIPFMPEPAQEIPTSPQIRPEFETGRPDLVTNDTGYIQVRTFTAREATPVANALVVILYEGNIVRQLVTDENGQTELVELETVDRNLSTVKGNNIPYVTYDIRVNADGYLPVISEAVPVFGGVTGIQNIALVPVPEFSDTPPTEIIQNTEPNL